MKHPIYLLLTGLFLVHSLHASDKRIRLRADSIMQQVIDHAKIYEHIVDSYEAEIYVKGLTTIPKKNKLIRYANEIFPVDHNPKDAFFEMSGTTRFNAPNHYRNDIQAINSNRLSSGKRYKEVLSFINLNVYAPAIYNKGFIMPLSPEAFKYYTFRLDSLEDTGGATLYHIRFTPRQWSQKLLSGYLYVADKYWTIDRLDVEGHSSFSEFRLDIRFSRDETHFILPEQAELQVCYHALGNRIESNYHAAFRYRSVAWIEEEQENKKHRSLDQTRYYSLSRDTIPVIRDSAYWNSRRDLPLTTDEQAIYNSGISPNRQEHPADSTLLTRYLRLGEQLTSTVNMDYRSTRVKYSGLLNPFQLSFGSNGITYRQQIRISKTFNRDRQLRFYPEIGYLFKKRELRFKVAVDWEYLPERLGALNLTLANENQSFSSDIIKKIQEQQQDSSFNFNDLHLKYFRHYHFQVQNKIELTNGLLFHTGLSFHHRRSVREKISPDEEVLTIQAGQRTFNEFVPHIGFTYTPRQYYWMDGYRKEYLYSHYPTFTTELARAVPDILGAKGNYWRFEAGMFQSVKLGLSERLSYNLSGGLFFNQHNTYFADFRYFAKHYFPESWGDRFGGVFHNLAGEWYNASDKYIQGHLMYESPFILLRFIKPRAHKYIVSERFYLSQLWTPVRPNYSELGYGVGSDICNIALFLSFEEFRYQSIGVKFALELFR